MAFMRNGWMFPCGIGAIGVPITKNSIISLEHEVSSIVCAISFFTMDTSSKISTHTSSYGLRTIAAGTMTDVPDISISNHALQQD
jgi:hypothetical protein